MAEPFTLPALPYVQTASYFIFKTIVSLLSTFMTVSILTIHRIEYQKNSYDEVLLNSPQHLSKTKKKKLKQYSTIQTIIRRLTWGILILFAAICIIYTFLSIIEQVGRINEIKMLLCTQWTIRLLSAGVQIGVGLLHCLQIAQLHEIYQNTQFAYAFSTLQRVSFFLMNVSLISAALLLGYLDVDPFDVTFFGQRSHSSCNVVVPTFLNFVVGGAELLVILIICHLFVKPMREMIRIHKSKDCDTEFTQALIVKVHKITTLSLTSTIITAACAFIIGMSNAIWAVFIFMPIDSICLLFMTSYYPNGYKKLCCLFILCRNRMFRRTNKAKLRSEQIRHMADQSGEMIDLKGIDDHERETGDYLERLSPLPLKDKASYDPYGVGKTDKLEAKHKKNLDLSYATLAAPKHAQVNTMELKMMDVTPLAIAKQTLSKSVSNESTEKVEDGDDVHESNNQLLSAQGMHTMGTESYELSDIDHSPVYDLDMRNPSHESTCL